ncbi:hypothetical protein BDE02_01G079400 [Populus trichocarpa]|nr:hypothetical protein BDE02_01G079400 [Populus trichocarpa]
MFLSFVFFILFRLDCVLSGVRGVRNYFQESQGSRPLTRSYTVHSCQDRDIKLEDDIEEEECQDPACRNQSLSEIKSEFDHRWNRRVRIGLPILLILQLQGRIRMFICD